ncbi:MAG: hypothetical protein KDD40_12820, partial [Bdellovibrionales bacterium]|nr:hypothetical protein [Bdellovibrionales bacterium]
MISLEQNVSLLQTQIKGGLLIWIIDTAPLFLGLFSRIGGLKQEKLEQMQIYRQAPLDQKIFKQYKALSKSVFLSTTIMAPLFTFAILATVSFLLFADSYYTERESHKRHLRAEANSFVAKVKLALSERLLAMDRMADRFTKANIETKEKWKLDAENYIKNFKGLKYVLWLNKNKKMIWQNPENNQFKQLMSDSLFNDFKYSPSDHYSYGEFSTSHLQFDNNEYVFSFHPTYANKQNTGYMLAFYDLDETINNFSDE